jgi:hypothetical protein
MGVDRFTEYLRAEKSSPGRSVLSSEPQRVIRLDETDALFGPETNQGGIPHWRTDRVTRAAQHSGAPRIVPAQAAPANVPMRVVAGSRSTEARSSSRNAAAGIGVDQRCPGA